MQPQEEESYDAKTDEDEEEQEETLVTLDDFYKTWEHVDTPIEISTTGEADGLPCLPGLCVNGVGDIALPLNMKSAEDLKKVCHQATKEGSLTKSNTYQVNGDQVYLTNPAWNIAFNKLVKEVAIKLGVMPNLVSSRLDKLVLQEKGQSVEEHCRTDEGNKVFAKLFVQLPSKFFGGSFVVTNDDGSKKTFSLDSKDSAPFQCRYFAHYSECKTEVLPVDLGCRVGLVYSLSYNGSERSKPSIRDIKYGRLLTPFRRLDEKVSMLCLPIKDEKFWSLNLSEHGIEALQGGDRIQAESALRAGGWKIVFATIDRCDTETADGAKFEEPSILEGKPVVDYILLLNGDSGDDEYLSWIKQTLDISSCKHLNWIEEDIDGPHEDENGSGFSRYLILHSYALVAFRDNLRKGEPPSKRRRTDEQAIVSD